MGKGPSPVPLATTPKVRRRLPAKRANSGALVEPASSLKARKSAPPRGPAKDGSAAPGSKWDLRFLALAEHISMWSKDPSTKVGGIIVGVDREIRSTGFNGFPRGLDDSEDSGEAQYTMKERLNDREQKYPLICHAEGRMCSVSLCAISFISVIAPVAGMAVGRVRGLATPNESAVLGRAPPLAIAAGADSELWRHGEGEVEALGEGLDTLWRHEAPMAAPMAAVEEAADARVNHTQTPRLTAKSYMSRAQARMSQGSCMPELMGAEGFLPPDAGLEKYVAPNQKVYFVGDSVMGQLCQLGSPGLCCSQNRPCAGLGRFAGGNWEVQLDNQAPYKDQGWQHLYQFRIRSKSDTGFGMAYLVAPAVAKDFETIDHAVQLVAGFLNATGRDSNDVMVLGMVGNHFNGDLEVFDKYMHHLIRYVVNPFPGRVVLLGYSPQHFGKTGHYSGSTDSACAPQPYPGEIQPAANSLRSAILIYNIWARLSNPRSRLVDVYEMLMPMWNCHRREGDCTHWRDAVISLQAQLVLNALEFIH